MYLMIIEATVNEPTDFDLLITNINKTDDWTAEEKTHLIAEIKKVQQINNCGRYTIKINGYIFVRINVGLGLPENKSYFDYTPTIIDTTIWSSTEKWLCVLTSVITGVVIVGSYLQSKNV
jgi:hypothetical protein